MESITQSQGTLWNIYPELLYQGLETGDQNSPVMIYTAQAIMTEKEGRERLKNKKRYHPSYIVPRQLFIWTCILLNASYSSFSPCKYWK